MFLVFWISGAIGVGSSAEALFLNLDLVSTFPSTSHFLLFSLLEHTFLLCRGVGF